jgi:hypothetical protein
MIADISKIAEEGVFLLMHEIEVTNNVTRMQKESLMTAGICYFY